MTAYRYVVFTNCREGTDSEFNKWYDDQHLGDVIAVPGFTGASRMRLVPNADKPARFRYLAIYEIESDDVDATIDEMMARAGTDRMPLSDTLAEFDTQLYEVITPTRTH